MSKLKEAVIISVRKYYGFRERTMEFLKRDENEAALIDLLKTMTQHDRVVAEMTPLLHNCFRTISEAGQRIKQDRHECSREIERLIKEATDE